MNERLRQIPLGGPPEPWTHLTSLAIGGVEAVGFSASEELLLVISASGRGLFELPAGYRVARDDDDGDSWWEVTELRARALAPIAEEWVAVAGIHGGGLPHLTADGWLLERVAPDWPNEQVFLSEPGGSAFGPEAAGRTYNLGPSIEGDLLVTYGFSRSGKYFLIATSSAIELFGRHSVAG